MQLFNRILGALLTPTLALTGMFAYSAPAEAQAYNYNAGNPGVANVSVANGGVVIVRGDSGAQLAATINAPLVPGDTIATSPGSNAEVQLDGISMLRLSSNTQVRFVNLSPGSREMQLAIGTVDLAELQGADGRPQIDSPSLTVRPSQTGDCRVSVLGNGQTLVTVRSGSASVATAAGSQTLTPGSTLVAYGPYSNPSVNLRGAIGFDSFDRFNISRDQALVASYNANPYLSPQLAGYANFANYGQWQNVPGYGYAWAPNNQNQTNFAPYQNGQWVWEPGYGYTWVDNAPYGYATSHYGSWFNNPSHGGWLWQPPGSQYQNTSSSLASTWLPAVVSFFLSGSNGGSFGGGFGGILGNLLGFLGNGNTNIGWIPLAPGEQYQPSYGQNYSYPSTGLTNVTNVTNIYNYYSNARYYRGVTMVPVSAWRSGNFKRLIVLRPQQFRQIVLIRGAVPVVPTTANLHYSRIAVVARPIAISRTFAAPRFAAKAPAVTHLSFTAQQAHIKAIASVKPRVLPLPAHRVVVHPIYVPVPHPTIHLMVIKPVAHPAKIANPALHPAKVVKPATPQVKVVKPVTPPVKVVKPVTPPVKVVKPVAPPVKVVKPVTPPVKVVRPTAHPVLPVVKPPTHTAPPVVKPVPHAPAQPNPAPRAPVTKPATPAKPAAHPARHASPSPKPAATTKPPSQRL